MGQYDVRFVYEQYFVQVSVIADSDREAIEVADSIVPFALGEPLEIESKLVGTYAV